MAVEQDGGDAGGAGTEHVERVAVADVEGFVRGAVGAAQGFGEKGLIGLGAADAGRDDHEVEVGAEAEG